MVRVTVYRFTGRQFGPVTIPDGWCPECELTVRVVRDVARSFAPDQVVVTTRPWLRSLFTALRVGGWHPPVVVVHGAVFSQGVVPDPDALRRRIWEALQHADPSALLHTA